MNKIIVLLLFGILSGFLYSCGSNNNNPVTPSSTTPTISFITITSTASTVTVSSTIQFTATATHTDNTSKDITAETSWSSSNI